MTHILNQISQRLEALEGRQVSSKDGTVDNSFSFTLLTSIDSVNEVVEKFKDENFRRQLVSFNLHLMFSSPDFLGYWFLKFRNITWPPNIVDKIPHAVIAHCNTHAINY
jgi:hypothetical protein